MYNYIKRIIDFLFAFLMIIALLPVFVIVSLSIKLNMGGSVLFKQKRIGLNNKPFTIYKFRSMKEKNTSNVLDFQRITGLGRILRVTRIDELPQLFNILNGDMSFIGPRPLIQEYLPFYTEDEIKRHNVRPGLSGLSQVSGSYPKWEYQFKKDIEYVNNMSFILDIKILSKTIGKILQPSRKLITGNAGRERFDNYRKNKIL